MNHVRTLSQHRAPVSRARLDLGETAILAILTAFFNDWDNFPQVIQNLQKFYSKTP